MSKDHTLARLRAEFEEQLGGYRAFADLPSTEIEAMAERLTRAVEPFLNDEPFSSQKTAA